MDQPAVNPLTMAELRAANTAAGGKFFSRGAMKGFRSRILPDLYHGRDHIYFVTSEKASGAQRNFTARVFHKRDASIGTLPNTGPGSGIHDTIGNAKARARWCAEQDRNGHTKNSKNQACEVCGHWGEGCTGDPPKQSTPPTVIDAPSGRRRVERRDPSTGEVIAVIHAYAPGDGDHSFVAQDPHTHIAVSPSPSREECEAAMRPGWELYNNGTEQWPTWRAHKINPEERTEDQ